MTNFTLELVTYPYLVYQLRILGFSRKTPFTVCAGFSGPLTEIPFYISNLSILRLTYRLKPFCNNNKINAMVYISGNMGICKHFSILLD